MFGLMVRTNFSAAHALRSSSGELVEPLHAHNWLVEVHLSSEKIDETGVVMDFRVVKAEIDNIIALFRGRNINDIQPFGELSPSAENIARYIYEELKKRLLSDINIDEVLVWETEDFCARFWQGEER